MLFCGLDVARSLRVIISMSARFNAPTGYVWNGDGLHKDPDLAVRRAIAMIFERFAVEPTVGAVVRWAHQTGFQVPTRHTFADGSEKLSWNALGVSRLKEILKSPIYAGAYAYGRRREAKTIVDGEIRTTRRGTDCEKWIALIREAHEGYISWETYFRPPKLHPKRPDFLDQPVKWPF